MKEIVIKVNGIWLEPVWAVAGTRESFGSCALKFEFSPEWDGREKCVTFFPAVGAGEVAVLVNNDRVIIPDEVMACAGSTGFIIDGIDGESKLFTQKGELRVVDTVHASGNPGEKTASLADQLRRELCLLRAEYEKLKVRYSDGVEIF